MCAADQVLLSMQQGRISDAETAVRKLWGKSKVESSMAELKASNVETVKGDNQDASWGELFGKRYRKGKPSCIHFMIVEPVILVHI